MFYIEKYDNLSELNNTWENTEIKNIDKNPFIMYDLILEYWKQFGDGKKIFIYVVNDNKDIILIMPLTLLKHNFFWRFNIYKLQFLAHPDTDYNTFLITDYEKAIKSMKIIFNDIKKCKIDDLLLSNIPENSYTKMLLDAATQKYNLQVRVNSAQNSYYIDLPNKYKNFLNNLGSNMKRNLRRWNKKAKKDFDMEFIKYDKLGSTEKSMNMFFSIHRERFKDTSMFNDIRYMKFHSKIANILAEKNMLALYFLLFDNEPASAIYGIEHNEKLYAYLCCYNPDFDDYSPGHLAFNELIKYTIEKGYHEFDFLRGNEEYKLLYKPNIRKNYEYYSLSFKDNLYKFYSNSYRKFLS